MDSLRGRKMYGLFYPPTREYFATVQLDEDFPDDMGFERSTIPGGRYARRKVQAWSGHEAKIKDWLYELAEQIKAEGLALDDERHRVLPQLERTHHLHTGQVSCWQSP